MSETTLKALQDENATLKKELLTLKKTPIIRTMIEKTHVIDNDRDQVLTSFIASLDLRLDDASLEARIGVLADKWFSKKSGTGAGDRGGSSDEFILPANDQEYFETMTEIKDKEGRDKYKAFVENAQKSTT